MMCQNILRYLANIINIQIVVILPLYPKKVGLAKPKGDAACWTVGMDWLGIEE